jgi:hypothetical protein
LEALLFSEGMSVARSRRWGLVGYRPLLAKFVHPFHILLGLALFFPIKERIVGGFMWYMPFGCGT